MRQLAFLTILLLSVSLSLGQQQAGPGNEAPYQPAVPPPSMGMYGGGGFGWGGMGGVGSTAAGSSMTGMANVISAKGDYNLSTSAAAVNMTQAQKNEIENRQQYTNTYFEMRETNRQAREAERGPRMTAEQLARVAHEYAPKPLSPGEMNAMTGKVQWPAPLQTDVFAGDRQKLERILGSYGQTGTLNYSDQTKARQIINDMNKQLKGQIRMLPGPDYMASKSFLESLMFSTCKCRLS
ncbi:MAG: hypothetical protein AB7O59_04485 [Pirellulales bacterium]